MILNRIAISRIVHYRLVIDFPCHYSHYYSADTSTVAHSAKDPATHLPNHSSNIEVY